MTTAKRRNSLGPPDNPAHGKKMTKSQKGGGKANKETSMQECLPLSPARTDRWRQIAAWVEAQLSAYNPEFGACSAPDEWKPQSDEEDQWAAYMRLIFSAKSEQGIARVCGSNFLIEGLATSDDEARYGEKAKSLDEVLSALVSAFGLKESDREMVKQCADDERQFAADAELPPEARLTAGILACDGLVSMCASKFTIIRDAIEKGRMTPEQRGECKAKQVYEEYGIVGTLARWRILSDSFLQTIADQHDFHRQNLAERWEHERTILSQTEGVLANASLIKSIRDAKAEIEEALPPGWEKGVSHTTRRISEKRRRAGKKGTKVSPVDQRVIAQEFRECRKKGYSTAHAAANEVRKRIEKGHLKVSAECLAAPPSTDTIKRYAKARK